MYAIVSSSVDSEIPVPEDHVRGEMKLSVQLFEPVADDANRCLH
jgi:hypothetical protein